MRGPETASAGKPSPSDFHIGTERRRSAMPSLRLAHIWQIPRRWATFEDLSVLDVRPSIRSSDFRLQSPIGERAFGPPPTYGAMAPLQSTSFRSFTGSVSRQCNFPHCMVSPLPTRAPRRFAATAQAYPAGHVLLQIGRLTDGRYSWPAPRLIFPSVGRRKMYPDECPAL